MTSTPLPHDSAHTHVSGRSEFVDDRLPARGEVFVEIVLCPHAHARIKSIEVRAARATPGVVGVFTGQDFHHNAWGPIFPDQPLLAQDIVSYAGEAVVLVAGETRDAAARGRKAVVVKYDALPAILSVSAAKAAQSWIAPERKIERGDVDRAFKESPHQLEGEIVIRGADHFYLESHAAIAYPREDRQIEVLSSTQHPTEVQHVVAHGLGLGFKDVVVQVKRMGGGFGGKETQGAPFAAYAALVAQKLGRPARVVLTKDDDMVITGKRNPFENVYRVGFDGDGRILALDAELYSDGGAYADLSTAIMERAMLHIDGAYFIPHLRVRGRVCRTNFHPHTAFRGFGGPKGVATIERVIEEIAHRLGKDPLEVRKLNCYSSEGGRDITHYGQKVENNCLPALFAQLERECDYKRRRNEIEKANAAGGRIRRGISLTSVKFGISFTKRFLNQANALVILHRDGTAQVSTGATEMGQGVNARVAEIVASELGLPRECVRAMTTSTEKNANTSPTAASSGTDLNGSAALLATRKLKSRLSALAVRLFELPQERWATRTAALGTEAEIPVASTSHPEDPNADADWATGLATYHGIVFEDGQVYRKGDPARKISLKALIDDAFYNRVSLSEYAYFKFPGLSFNNLTGQGRAFLYYTQGVAASEVSVDLDTGEVKVQRADILMDLGRPINEGLDLGQVVGGFVQGMGWVTTEKLHYKDGFLVTHSPSTYKIPSVHDAPRVLNAKLFRNDGNRANVRGTKAAGEPPLLLAISVWTAIHDALKGLAPYGDCYPRMELPATDEEILRAAWPERFERWENS